MRNYYIPNVGDELDPHVRINLGLVAWYPMLNGYGHSHDITSYNNHAVVGSPDGSDYLPTALGNYGARLDGSGKYMKIKKPAKGTGVEMLDGSTGMAINFWSYFTGLDTATREDVLMRYSDGGGSNLQFYCIWGLGGTDNFRWVVYTSGASNAQTDVTGVASLPVKNKWCNWHINFGYKTIYVYLNGSNVGTTILAATTSDIRADAGHITIGINPTDESSNAVNGIITNLRIWNRYVSYSKELQNLTPNPFYGIKERNPYRPYTYQEPAGGGSAVGDLIGSGIIPAPR